MVTNNKRCEKLFQKNVHLSKECIQQLSKDAIDNGTVFKVYIEELLEKIAKDRAAKKK